MTHFRSAWLAQLVEFATLDLGVVNSSPMLDIIEFTLKKKKKNKENTDTFQIQISWIFMRNSVTKKRKKKFCYQIEPWNK